MEASGPVHKIEVASGTIGKDEDFAAVDLGIRRGCASVLKTKSSSEMKSAGEN